MAVKKSYYERKPKAMSEHEKDMMDVIRHFNVRLNEIAGKGGALTAYEEKLLKKLDFYSEILKQHVSLSSQTR